MLGFRQLSSKYTNSFKKLVVNSFNLFGIQPRLTITKAKSVNTIFGSTFTIILLVLIITLFLHDLSEFILREKPTVIQSDSELDINKPIKEYPIDQSNFTLALAIYNKDFMPIEQMERYFTLSIQFCKKTKNNPQNRNLTFKKQNPNIDQMISCTQLETVPCQQNNFQDQDIKKYFGGANLSHYMCIKNNQFEILKPVIFEDYIQSLQGVISSDTYQYLTIKLSICRNNTDRQDCFPEENNKNQLFQTYYTYYLTDNLIQLDNSQNLTQQILRTQNFQILKNYQRQIKQQYKVVESEVDKTFIYAQKEYSGCLQLQDQKEVLIFDPSDTLINQEIDLSYKQTKFIITHTKISALLGKLGGYIFIIYIFFDILLIPINRFFYLIQFTNKIFRFKVLQNDFVICQQENEQVIQKSAYFQNIESPNSYCWANVNESLLLQNTRIYTYLQNLKASINLTWAQTISILLGCSRDKKKQLKEAEIRLNKKTNVAYLVKKLIEIEKLKYVLLNDDQLNIFNSIEKPMLFVDEKTKKNKQKQYFDEDSKITKIQKGFKSYVSLQVKPQKGATDLKLLSLLDSDMINLYEQLYRELTFKSFFQNIALKESKTFKSKKDSKEASPDQHMHKHIKLQTNADQ
ncbi:unnamed protein product (macronuclear) [Paramecium tetraurelia]|uniref:Transmembrane protein n=1 Tax=Paramecium tetraurelia TaxID=5888 RepID=A0DZ81_PARTE|nr:uncharacterized protein GSPATT00003317001 [Paramecium tetraurelia]CAK88348.1 unnamed protein product [Paramecium tetraurelia]|eukprot:XP_001455745.1 hypothetical protein (macronuclear) [Paramecium tetraurelia strain d4-2]